MNKFIKIGKEKVSVTEEVYKAYYKSARRDRYYNKDIKVGRIEVDMEKEKITFIDSKEDSLQRLTELGNDFAANESVEDIVCDKAMLHILENAIDHLDDEEQELIRDIYYNNRTFRQIAGEKNVSHVAVVKRHRKVLEKLKKYFL